jgi:glycosyltransferase involved in cell wall biosynthesis
VKRLAFFSPIPPAPSGVADYAADVLALLAGRYEIDVFHDQPAPARERVPAAFGLHPHTEFDRRRAERPYDLAVHQMGNGPAHDFVYAPLARAPGLLVLHDLVLHHARGRMFLDSPEARAYAAAPEDARARDAAAPVLARYADEVRYSYPAEAERLVAAQLGTVGDLLPYAYPLFRLPVEASRLVAVHNEFMAEAVRAAVPGTAVVRIPMPITPLPVDEAAVAELRARYGIAASDVVVGTFGLVTREKRIETVARAVARAAALRAEVRLLVVGPVPDRPAIDANLAALGLGGRAIVTGRVPWSELAAHIALADVVAHLRYPTARETSAALLRVLGQGKATVMGDLENLAEVPAAAVLRVDPSDEEGDLTRAILRLAGAPLLRARLGEGARGYVLREHSATRASAAYVEAIEHAAGLPDPKPRAWPAHWARLTARP